MISCDLSSLLAPVGPVPTTAPGVVDTIVALTAAAAYTQTAANVTVVPTMTSTLTPTATHTPTPTLSPTPTFIFILASLTPTRQPTATGQVSGGYGCQLTSQTPANGTHYSPKKNFTVKWTLKNIGQNDWDQTVVDFEFLSGAKMFTGASIYDLPNNVVVGKSVTLSVPMAAPKADGTYNSVWSLKQGKNDFCHVNIRIIVP